MPFWFSTAYRWTALMPFSFSAVDRFCVGLITGCFKSALFRTKLKLEINSVQYACNSVTSRLEANRKRWLVLYEISSCNSRRPWFFPLAFLQIMPNLEHFYTCTYVELVSELGLISHGYKLCSEGSIKDVKVCETYQIEQMKCTCTCNVL